VKTYGTLDRCRPGRGPGGPPWCISATPDVTVRLKRLFPRIETSRRGELVIRDTPEVCRDLVWAMMRWPLEMSDADRTHLEASARHHEDSERAVLEILAGRMSPTEGLMDFSAEVRDYQVIAAEIVRTTGRLLLADEVGVGKSYSGLHVLRDPDALPALIVTLTHLPSQWAGYLAEALPLLRGHILKKGTPYDFSRVRELHGHDPDVLICNYSKLSGWAAHLSGKVRTVIFDECQELRRSGSQKYDAAGQIADGARFRMGLTATPVYNYGGEIHNVISILDADALGSHDEFVREWARTSFNGHVLVNDPKALGSHLRDHGLMLRRTRDELGRQLPSVIPIQHTVGADDETFERLSGDALDLAQMIIERSGTKEQRWQASGDLDWKLRHATGLAKAPYVAEFVRLILESEQQVVLYGWHHDVYDLWAQRLGEFKPVSYTGRETSAGKERAKQAFVHGDSRVLMMSLRSGAGLDGLQEVCHVNVFGELDWSPLVHDQCNGRLARDGMDTEHPVVAYYLVSDCGSDPVMAEVLNVKRQQADPIVDPDVAMLQQVTDTTDRVRRLAEDVLRKRGRKVSDPARTVA
jgi:hypothetical protein